MTFTAYYKKYFKSKNEAARVLGISRPLVYKLLRGGTVEREVAKRIEERTGRELKAAELMQL